MNARSFAVYSLTRSRKPQQHTLYSNMNRAIKCCVHLDDYVLRKVRYTIHYTQLTVCAHIFWCVILVFLHYTVLSHKVFSWYSEIPKKFIFFAFFYIYICIVEYFDDKLKHRGTSIYKKNTSALFNSSLSFTIYITIFFSFSWIPMIFSSFF